MKVTHNMNEWWQKILAHKETVFQGDSLALCNSIAFIGARNHPGEGLVLTFYVRPEFESQLTAETGSYFIRRISPLIPECIVEIVAMPTLQDLIYGEAHGQ